MRKQRYAYYKGGSQLGSADNNLLQNAFLRSKFRHCHTLGGDKDVSTFRGPLMNRHRGSKEAITGESKATALLVN